MTTTQVYLKTDEDGYQNILHRFRRTEVTFSKAVAAKLVGGRYALEQLVREHRIRMNKPSTRQNSTWQCNGEDVIRIVSQQGF